MATTTLSVQVQWSLLMIIVYLENCFLLLLHRLLWDFWFIFRLENSWKRIKCNNCWFRIHFFVLWLPRAFIRTYSTDTGIFSLADSILNNFLLLLSKHWGKVRTISSYFISHFLYAKTLPKYFSMKSWRAVLGSTNRISMIWKIITNSIEVFTLKDLFWTPTLVGLHGKVTLTPK